MVVTGGADRRVITRPASRYRSCSVTGFAIQRQERSRAGIIQRVIAVRPAKRSPAGQGPKRGAYLFATRATVHCGVRRLAVGGTVVVSMRTGIKRLTVRTRSR